MRLLCINPNTTHEVTTKVVDAGRELAPAGWTIEGATGRFGARYISSRSSAAIAAHATLDAYAEHGRDADAILLACFGDPGLLALRELAHCRVLGLAEASCLAACELGPRFSIITGGERWPAMLHEFVAQIGLSQRLASIRAVAPSGGEIAANPRGAHSLLAEACQLAVREDGADVVILGGAGLVGIADHIRSEVKAPLLCSVETGFRSAYDLMGAHFVKPADGTWALPPAVETIGLNSSLARLLSPGQ